MIIDKKTRYDVGVDGRTLTGLVEFDLLPDKRTWELPEIRPTGSYNIPKNSPVEVILTENEAIEAVIKNVSAKPVWINGFTFNIVLPETEDLSFSFPANVPHGTFKVVELENLSPVSAGLVNFAVAIHGGKGCFNILFIDEIEKWSTAVWRDGNETNIAFCPAVEAELMPGEAITVDKLYLRGCEAQNQLAEIREFVKTLGFFPPADGSENNGPMYSCHPYGTMDTNFKSLKEDLFQFAERLPGLKKMGIGHLWILPVFDHDEKGVYHSNDQNIIDARYGGEEAARYYGEKARESSINLLYDYVPHGPVPTHPLALDNPSWCAKQRDGSLQIEWDCVSMDYNNEEYLSYMENLVRGHVKRFGVGGARIDCAMGGLSNWHPVAGLRPSASSVRAGVNISRAIRQGFTKEGIKPLNMPENFHPIPPYYAQTDIFYGFNLYRVFCEIEPLFKENPRRYCAELTGWLKAENEVLPKNLRKLRFLGNHDTVTWVWQKRRAAAIYGTEGAKALWALISLIDGIPMIYQGDEDPSLYNAEGENLTGFFTELFSVRKKLSGDLEYIETGAGVFAFKRGGKTLVMVNLNDAEESFGGHNLAPYQYKVVEL